MSQIVVFYDPDFPYAGERPRAEDIERLRQSFVLAGAEELSEHVRDPKTCGLVTLHAPYFPKNAWQAIRLLLERKGFLLSVGERPFKHPVRSVNDGYAVEKEQTAYLQQLHIHEAISVDSGRVKELRHNPDLPLFKNREALFSIEETCALVLHATKYDDHPHENGSSGPMDAHIYPLLKGVSETNREVSAPAVLIENTKGEYAGGRWMMINQKVRRAFWEKGGVEAIREWTKFLSAGVTEMWIKPNYAVYEPGERPLLTLQWQRLKPEAGSREDVRWDLEIELRKEKAEAVWKSRLSIQAGAEIAYRRIPVPHEVKSGLYTIRCRAVSEQGEERVLHQGFWGNDPALLREGSRVTCGRDYFHKDGQPLPVVGMTYMTSDVARKFVFLPNVAAWDKDMAEMKRAGINWIRTGIWTAYRHIMFVDGHPSEEVLRAIDAFILTAKKHDLQVTFNFFAFTPESWEGENPYLDPRSVKAQKRFISALVSRHKQTTNVDWDLINEPSLFDPARIFEGPRPSGDRFEKAAFREWLRKRHQKIETLQERWNMTPDELPDFDAADIPEPADINFDVEDMKQPKKGTRWLDYTLFTMDMHNRWARELAATIKQIAPEQLVTVGQDEALRSQRPTPFFYAEAVDYTTNHTWWMLDHLVWDGIFTKAPDKPNLIQETGIMYVETPDGRAKRSELELRNILERKYAYAFAAGGAGAVQWLWNTNVYMDNVNESNIGALRADGTQKPEADVSYDFGRFISQIRSLFAGRALEETVVIFPYANDFSNRKLAFDATTRLTRVFAYELKMPFRALGEYGLDDLKNHPPKLIIVPSAHNFSNDAFERLIDHVRRVGGTLLYTGPLGLNEYWQPEPRLSEALGKRRLCNVLREECLHVNGRVLPVSFGDRRIAEVSKEETEPARLSGTSLAEAALGKGRLIWCPLPVELNDRTEVLKELYSYALNEAGIERELDWIEGGDLPGIYGRKVSFAKGALFVFVSEYAHDAVLCVRDRKTNRAYRFTLEKERSVLFAVDEAGKVISVYRAHEVDIQS